MRRPSCLWRRVGAADDLDVKSDEQEAEDIEFSSSGDGEDDAPAVKLANAIILQALKEKAIQILCWKI